MKCHRGASGFSWLDDHEFIDITKRAAAAALVAILLGPLVLEADSGATLSFTRLPPISLGDQCCSVVTGDFNRDGKADIAAAHGQAGITIFLGDGKGDFTRSDWSIDLGSGVLLKGLVTSADFNADGIADIAGITADALGNFGSVVLLGRGDGSFRAPIILGGNVAKAVADFNGDGKLDLLVHPCSSDIDCGFAVRFGNGDGTFQPPGPVASQPAGDFTWAAVADFNGDGKLDVVETTFRPAQSGAVYLWLGKGDGTFGSVTAIPLTNGTSFVTSSQLATGDFNGDGKADLAVLIKRGSTIGEPYGIEILLGDGKGGFTLGGSYSVPTAAPLITADFQHAGHLDVAAGFTLLAGHGDGSFTDAESFGQYVAPVVPQVPGGISWVAMGDFTGDGKADLVGPAGDGSQLSVLVNNTPGSDASANAVSAADYTFEVAPGSIASLFGTALATTTAQVTMLPLPTSLANTMVRVLDANGVERLGELLYVSPTQINFVIPAATASGFAIFNVAGSRSIADGTRSTLIAPLAPAFFALDSTGQGPPAATAIRAQADGSQAPVPIAQCSVAGGCVPIPIDLSGAGAVYLSIYGTGFREATAAACDTSSGTVTSGGSPPITVTYVGPQPTATGLDQMNLRLSNTLPSGSIEIRCQFRLSGTVTSAAFALAIQ